jgi:alkylated DNA repair protein (DNA oxidative demethylase)
MSTADLFTADPAALLRIGAGACVLPGFALPAAQALLACVREIELAAPPRQMVTPGGFTMSVAMTNCGELGWVTDRKGYRYTRTDPESGKPWPALPPAFARLAAEAAEAAGFAGFAPDACLINRYTPGTRLTLHQDRNERDFAQPIVSVSLGMDATFLFGNVERAGRVQRIPLRHGDVVVWGGEDRLRFHGVAPLKDAPHPLLGSVRINLTFRKAG